MSSGMVTNHGREAPWRSAWRGGLFGLLLGLPWLSLMWLGYRLWGVTMAPFALFDLLARALPGSMVTTGLEFMIELLTNSGVASTAQAGKALEAGLALLLALTTAGLLGGLHGWVRHKQPYSSALPLGMSLGLAGLMLSWWDDWGGSSILVGAGWPFALGLAWGLSLDWLGQSSLRGAKQPGSSRRGFIGIATLAAGALSLLALGAARWLAQGSEAIVSAPFPARPTPIPPAPAVGFNPAAGLRSEVTSMTNFFRVDINLRSPRPDQVLDKARQQAMTTAEQHQLRLPESDYLLSVYGLVQRPRVLSLEQVLGLNRVDQFATLECISNPIAGDLIDTTLFSGAPLAEVLALAGLSEQVEDLVFHCADGYSESLPIAAALDDRTMLCYAMGGEALPERHGFPYRLFTPDRFGMKNPKWIVAIEAVAEDYSGYWQQRGWVEQAWVQTEAVIDAIQAEGLGNVRLAGIAFAGDRGISGVEIQVDGSEWEMAALNRSLAPLTWVQWAHTFEGLGPGEHTFQVRAIDGRGDPQPSSVSEPYPAGATGYHRRRYRL